MKRIDNLRQQELDNLLFQLKTSFEKDYVMDIISKILNLLEDSKPDNRYYIFLDIFFRSLTEISFNYDDSVLLERINALKNQWLIDFKNGLLKFYEYFLVKMRKPCTKRKHWDLYCILYTMLDYFVANEFLFPYLEVNDYVLIHNFLGLMNQCERYPLNEQKLEKIKSNTAYLQLNEKYRKLSQ